MATQKYHFPILIEQDEDDIFIVSCPVFKGCHSYGKTIDEAMKNIQEVIEMCLEEEKPNSLNHFIGFREIEMQVAV
ncbi:type II toxin-antitoxin system HicB family antitoxin [Nemorincola caseinilytica]|uniref:Type II toxin-antitoxin system HicB family antitoxin n=1 Tax=Nemorincola caseinilytica TaxID=2054315 RepID=A0ABP8NE75_9BACT